MIRLVWSEKAGAVQDAHVKSIAERIRKKVEDREDSTYYVSNEMAIQAIRLLVIQGKIPYKQILVVYENEPIRFKENGDLEKWPPGFCTTMMSIMQDIIKAKKDRQAAQTDSDIVGISVPAGTVTSLDTSGL